MAAPTPVAYACQKGNQLESCLNMYSLGLVAVAKRASSHNMSHLTLAETNREKINRLLEAYRSQFEYYCQEMVYSECQVHRKGKSPRSNFVRNVHIA
jgi:hypothetical protein